MCVTSSARMGLMHINIKIVSAVLSRPRIQVSFHLHYFATYFDITYFEMYEIA